MLIKFDGGKITKLIWDLNENNDVILSKYTNNDVRNDNNIGYDEDIFNNKCDDIVLEFNEYINGYRVGYNITGNIKGLQFNTNLNNKYICGTFKNLDYDSKLILFNNKYLSGFYYNHNNNVLNKMSFQFSRLTNDLKSLTKRRLGTVLNKTGPLEPRTDVPNAPETDYDPTTLVIFFDEECANNFTFNSTALNDTMPHEALIDEFLVIGTTCFTIIQSSFGFIFAKSGQWFIFVNFITTEACLANITVDHELYCIKDVVYQPLLSAQGEPNVECQDNTNGEYVPKYLI